MESTAKQIVRISKPILSAVLWVLIWFSNGNTEGYVKLGVWPRHNEDILNAHSDITKFRVELSQRFRISRVELELNPVFKLGGTWPKYTTQYGYDWINLEANVILRFFATEKMNLYYHSKRYHDIFAKPGASWCNCTYSNEVGMQYNW